jgi:tryptophan synthase alpha chain
LNGIDKVFEELEGKREGALIGYVTAGDPNPKLTSKIANALILGGVDILELGLPFSDPIADGPTIQAASVRALNAGTTPELVLKAASEIKMEHDVPLVIMTYYNPVFKMGVNDFVALSKKCMVDGLIVPDLPIEEADDYRKAAATHGLDTIFLAAPSTTNERLNQIVSCSSGFLYLISHFGVTGVQNAVEESTLNLVKRISSLTKGKIPLAVGFGISTPDQVSQIKRAGAEGVIVGSAFVNIINKNQGNTEKMLDDLEALAQKLKKATC